MSWSRFLVACVACAALVRPAPAGLFFKKKTRPNPAERVPELIVTVKTEQDARKRAAAAAELRQYDAKAYPDIVPILADVLRNDPKPAVRLEALQSLSRLRPVSPDAGAALEEAASRDKNLRVRMQARTALMYYRLSGYRSPKTDQPPKTNEPPLAVPNKGEPPLAAPDPPPAAANRLTPRPNPAETAPPPAADGPEPRPLPPGPAAPPLVPTEPPKLQTPPAPGQDQGPSLTPPR